MIRQCRRASEMRTQDGRGEWEGGVPLSCMGSQATADQDVSASVPEGDISHGAYRHGDTKEKYAHDVLLMARALLGTIPVLSVTDNEPGLLHERVATLDGQSQSATAGETRSAAGDSASGCGGAGSSFRGGDHNNIVCGREGGDSSDPKIGVEGTERQKTEEKNRKGRERSLRTRKRNMARLRTLEDNCTHLEKENNVMRDMLAGIVSGMTLDTAQSLTAAYAELCRTRPEPHIVVASDAENARGISESALRTLLPANDAKPSNSLSCKASQVPAATVPSTSDAGRIVQQESTHAQAHKMPSALGLFGSNMDMVAPTSTIATARELLDLLTNGG